MVLRYYGGYRASEIAKIARHARLRPSGRTCGVVSPHFERNWTHESLHRTRGTRSGPDRRSGNSIVNGLGVDPTTDRRAGPTEPTMEVIMLSSRPQRITRPIPSWMLVAAASPPWHSIGGLIVAGTGADEDPVPADEPEPTIPAVEPEPEPDADAVGPVPHRCHPVRGGVRRDQHLDHQRQRQHGVQAQPGRRHPIDYETGDACRTWRSTGPASGSPTNAMARCRR